MKIEKSNQLGDEKEETLKTTFFTPNYGREFPLPVLLLFDSFHFFAVFKKSRKTLKVITKASHTLKNK